MYLQKLFQRNFRNLKGGSLLWSRGLNVILGDNGSGKTSVIEAIYFLATAKSFRTSVLRDLVQRGEKAAKVEGNSTGKQRYHLAVDYDGEGRKTRLNGELVPVSRYVGSLPIIFYSTASLQSIEGYPERRRELLDRGIFLLDRRYLKTIKTYRHILQQKRRLLRERSLRRKKLLLQAWNQELAEYGAYIITARQEYVERLSQAMSPVFHEMTGWKTAVSLEYKTPYNVRDREDLLKAIDKHAVDEQEKGICLVGPHRDDLRMSIGGHAVKAFASEGEKRALLLSLALAQREIYLSLRGEEAILLFDDITAEFDRKRIKRILFLLEKEGQVFITSSDMDQLVKHGKHFILRAGAIHAQ